MRYDNKAEFFQSLEQTVLEFITTNDQSDEQKEIENEIAANLQKVDNFKLKPGHRNFILNLMSEVEKTNYTDFLSQTQNSELFKQDTEEELSYVLEPEETIIPEEHGYSRENEEEYYIEEYITDDSQNDEKLIQISDAEYYQLQEQRKMKNDLDEANKSTKAKRPDHMYNDEFLSKNINPKRRRVKKNYPPGDEGITMRFVDLLSQSLQCILPRDRYEDVKDAELHVTKHSDTVWNAQCPICQFVVRLAVVYENNGKYVNYKRSNFERHLRFKHCKQKDHQSEDGFEC